MCAKELFLIQKSIHSIFAKGQIKAGTLSSFVVFFQWVNQVQLYARANKRFRSSRCKGCHEFELIGLFQ